MSSEIAIKVESLSKCYHIYETPRDRLKQFILPRIRRLVGLSSSQYFREFWALKNVSFEVRKGETVGIIGRNGSGKSTLLQLICGTLSQTGGGITTQGRIAALLELGSGFNPEFSGRENVYMSCALLGLRQEEIDSRFDDIAAFADIGDFIEQPVKTYSSGMFVRLAFAVNVISSPDIMVVDEALAVGDMNFQAKCMTALTRFQERGGTVLFVSHDVGAIKSLCQQAVYLEHGQIVSKGPAREVAECYVRAMREEMSEDIRKFARASNDFSQNNSAISSSDPLSECAKTVANPTADRKMTDLSFKRSEDFDRRVAAMRYGSGGVRITYLEFVDLDGYPIKVVSFNQEVGVRIYVESQAVRDVSINFQIRDDKGIAIVGCGFSQVGQSAIKTSPGRRYVAEYKFRLALQEGVYSVRAHLSESIIHGKKVDYIDVVEDAVVFRMESWGDSPIWSKVHVFPMLLIRNFD